MKAIVLEKPGQFQHVELAEPSPPAAGEALVRVPPRRNLRHGYQRLTRKIPLLQLPAHPGT